MTAITLNLPAPPSVNRLWRVGAGGRVYLDARYVAWKRTAGWEVMAIHPGRFPPGAKVAVSIRAGKAKRARDLDNYGKGVLDLIQGLGIIDNDRNVADLRIAWDDSIEPGRVRIEVRAMKRAAA